jgi:hypothetical protein
VRDRAISGVNVKARPTTGSIVGATGQVVGRVAPGVIGEVLISTATGTRAYYAHPAFSDDTFEVGAAVRVLQWLPPRTVTVVAS